MIPFPKDLGLAGLRESALAAVEAAAQAVEVAEVPSPARAAIYNEKERQALAVLADPTPDPADYDLVAVDMEVDGLTVHGAAMAIMAAADRMRTIAVPLERWRRGRNAAINAATTVAELRAIDTSAMSLMAAIAADQT